MQKPQQNRPSDLSELSTFVAIARTGSLAAAARQLDRDAAVISRRLQALEDRLGIRLIERSTRHVALTEAGMAYLARVEPLLRTLETADQDVAAFADGEPRGHLRLSLPGNFGRLWIGPLLLEFLERHPQVTAEATSTNRFVDLIGEGYDAAIRLGSLPDSRLIARKVADRRRVVCAAPSYLDGHDPITTPGELVRHNCLRYTGLDDPNRWTFARPGGNPQAVAVTGNIASDDAEFLAEACLAGFGVLNSTDWYVGLHLATGRLVELLEDWSSATSGAVYVVTPTTAGMPSKTRAFSDFVAKKLSPPPWRT